MKYNTKTSIVGKTDMGRVRTNNEDAFVAQTLWDENTFLAIAIDGVGGYEGGEIAADIARKTIPEFLMASSNGERVELLKQAVTAANNAIFEAREADPEHGQMSCVLTAAVIDVVQRQISMAHVGDSRLYSFHRGNLRKLSHDHSLIGYREEIGDLTEEEAMHHPQRNVIGRDVGSQKHKTNDDDFIEAQVFDLRPNTTLLFCSDGLTDMITSSAIKTILGQQANLDEKADALVKAALEAGGKDNVTVVLFEYQSDEPEPTPAENTKKERPIDASSGEHAEEYRKTAENEPKNKGLKPVLFFIGLLLGFAVAYFGFNSHPKETDKDNAELNKLHDSIARLNDSIDKLNVQPLEIDSTGTIPVEKDLESQLNQANSTIQSVEKERDDLKKERDNLKKANDGFKTERDSLRQKLNEKEKELKALVEKLN